MASILKVDTIQDQAGNNIISESANVITIGASGDTITVPAGATVSGFTSAGIDDNATSTVITIESGGDVGIGTTNPAEKLQVMDTASNIPKIRLETSDGGNKRLDLSVESSVGTIASTQSAQQLAFKTAGGEAVRIDATGQVGIGTSSPATPLHILTTDGGNVDESLTITNASTTSGTGSRIRFVSSTDISSTPNSVSISSYRNAGSDHDLLFESSNAEKMRITSSGNVGIGESSPLGKVHAKSADSGASVNSGHNQFVAENSGNSGMSIISGNTSNGAICFGDDGNNCIGYINYAHNGNHLDFGVSGAERMRVDASGDMLLGKTSISTNAVGVALTGSGLGAFTRSGDAPIIANRTSSDGDAILIRKDNSTVGVIGTQKWGIGNSNPQNKLDISALTWDDGLTIKNTGNFNVGIIADANRSGAGGGILNLQSRWNGTEVSGILFVTGSDTTNKDDGEIIFRTASAGTPHERMRIDRIGKVRFNTTTSNNGMVISNGSDTAGDEACYGLERGGFKSTMGMSSTGSMHFKNFSGEIKVEDSSGNVTTISPHNFSAIPNGVSEDLAWAYYSRKGDEENDFDNTKYTSADITKVIRKIENLTGDKLIYTGTGSTDDGSTVSQNIIQSLIDRIEGLEAEVTALKNQPQ